MKPVCIVGAGNSGFSMAAHLLSSGQRVALWNRSDENMFAPVHAAGGIKLTGLVEGLYLPELMTHDMAAALRDVDLILVTVPASAHASVITTMAPQLRDGQTIVLNPGRTCGALMCHNLLRAKGVTADVTIAETGTIVYTCRKSAPDTAAILAFKNKVPLAALQPSRTQQVLELIPECIRPRFKPAGSVLETGLGNVGMILHCAPMLFNIGWIETTRSKFKYYYDGITPSIADFLELLDQERLAVAARCGIETPSIADWMRLVYDLSGDNLYECVRANACYREIDAPPTLQHRYLLEDVPTGLVPLEAIGQQFGVPVPLSTSIIDLASTVLGLDLREKGRNAAALGLRSGASRDEVIETLGGRLS